MSAIDYAGPGILRDQFTPCHRMDRITDRQSDGQFGSVEHYDQGAAFDAMLRKDGSTEVTVAEQNGLNEVYTVVVGPGVALKKNDVIRRDSDGATFLITGRTIDGAAPPASTVQIAKTTAKRWDIP